MIKAMTILELRDRLNFYIEKAGVAKDAPVYFGETPVTYCELIEDYESDESFEMIDYITLGCHAGFDDFSEYYKEVFDIIAEVRNAGV